MRWQIFRRFTLTYVLNVLVRVVVAVTVLGLSVTGTVLARAEMIDWKAMLDILVSV